jgi:hypothetical protein
MKFENLVGTVESLRDRLNVDTLRVMRLCAELITHHIKPIWNSGKFLREGHIHTKDSSASYFLAHFPLGKESYCPHFVCLSVTASSFQGLDRFGRFIAWSKAYGPRSWIMVIDPGRGLEDLISLKKKIYILNSLHLLEVQIVWKKNIQSITAPVNLKWYSWINGCLVRRNFPLPFMFKMNLRLYANGGKNFDDIIMSLTTLTWPLKMINKISHDISLYSW